jgi:hypothetical protein
VIRGNVLLHSPAHPERAMAAIIASPIIMKQLVFVAYLLYLPRSPLFIIQPQVVMILKEKFSCTPMLKERRYFELPAQ